MKIVKLATSKYYEVSETETNTTQVKNLLNSGKMVYSHYSTGNFYYKVL